MARQDLGLTDDDWLSMTPRQLFALRKRRIEQMQWTELMFSRLTAATYNSGFSRPETPYEQTHFMLHPFKAPQSNGHTPEEELPGDTLLRMLAALPPGAARRV
jgi:hypothetical protein